MLGPHGVSTNKISNPDNWIAIVGDSGVTGAASSKSIEPTVANLFAHILSFLTRATVKTEVPPLEEFPAPERFHLTKIEPLTRVPYSRAEFKQGGGWIGHLGMNLGAKLSLALDVPEHGFGYLVGSALGVKASDIVLVGQDGVMIKTLGQQFGRIFEMRTKTLPPLVLVSFTANDLCDKRVFERSAEEWAEGFKQALAKAWDDAKPYLQAHARGTRIVVLAPLDVVNVITNPEVLAQITNVEGQGEITCGQLRHGKTRLTVSSWFIMRMLNLMCPSVTTTQPEDTVRLDHLRRVQDLFGEAWKAQIAHLNAQYAEKRIQWIYLEAVRELKFSTGDVGNDCFHPSVRGHSKLAELILQEGLQ